VPFTTKNGDIFEIEKFLYIAFFRSFIPLCRALLSSLLTFLGFLSAIFQHFKNDRKVGQPKKWSRYGQIFMYLSTLFALEKLDTSTTKAHLQTKTRQQHSDKRPIGLIIWSLLSRRPKKLDCFLNFFKSIHIIIWPMLHIRFFLQFKKKKNKTENPSSPFPRALY
jgi:hypothetical protein